ncbi:diacylglycerol kinase family protein [Oenococcus oeni]|uniref:diacylglycerol kinase family protein n=1 Tax=Oenococcus oeni TaxID=1247 RepID=UPI000277B500|nr:diacylglycerol kinase family protein [Oenococcus oeni]AWW99527.1 diacylglycerol kinase [Oenococcus oeni]EJN98884.1 diacylglycerol kinase [Oenococcus oeni AWRIB419]EJO06021.1 diacylglycerol kinase [Oenococcus oeni AWRIB553]EJO06971.1 diacylglycerol kinase [Oenococcus oeni AWRIB422]EJO07722.1 diacylglycerol kinase [Oenococcus oeni AWRIB548]
MGSQNKKPIIQKRKTYKRNKTFFAALFNAFNGIWIMISRERNFRIHIVIALLVLWVGIYFHLSRSDWLWVTVGVFFAIVAEILNTIIEAIVDLTVGDRYDDLAKLAKDVAAAGVVFAVFIEFTILAIILQPYFWVWLGIHNLFNY